MSSITALKILIAGEFEQEKRDWYYRVAKKMANNQSNDNVIYFLSNTLDRGADLLVNDDPESNDVRMILIGMGKDF